MTSLYTVIINIKLTILELILNRLILPRDGWIILSSRSLGSSSHQNTKPQNVYKGVVKLLPGAVFDQLKLTTSTLCDHSRVIVEFSVRSVFVDAK